MNKKMILGIDYNNLMLRSYFSKELINGHGINVNAIKGFFFKLQSIKNFIDPDYIIIATDLGREKTFRRKMYDGYKANRSKTDYSAVQQMDYGKKLLDYLGYPIINNPIYEADDILGMLSRFAMDNNMNMIIASSDKDYYQLINDNISVFNDRTKKIIDLDFIRDTYSLEPDQLIDVKGLAGDSSDNIPGAKGIGEKTALTLIQKFGSIDNVYQNIDSIKEPLCHILKDNNEMVYLSKTLGTILTDYSIMDLSMDTLLYKEPDIDSLFSLLRQLELFSLINVMRYSLI